MNILEKLLPPRNNVFYECLENSAKNCSELAAILNEIIKGCEITDDLIMKTKALKNRGLSFEHETLSLLNSTFITPIDREDIQTLASMLTRINKKFAQAIFILDVYKFQFYPEELTQQAATILRAAKELFTEVALLKTLSKTREITASCEIMKEIGAIGDEIHYRAMKKLFSGEFESLTVIKLSDIYKVIETALDECYSVSDIILNVALKNG